MEQLKINPKQKAEKKLISVNDINTANAIKEKRQTLIYKGVDIPRW